MNWKKFSPLLYVVIVALFLADAYAGRLQTFDSYLGQLDYASGSKIPVKVRAHLVKVHKDKTYGAQKVSAKALEASHQDFNNHKNTLIKDWEQAMGRSWPTYTVKTECVTNGTCITKKKGQRYDAHHIIPQSYKGPNKWWNLIPLDVRRHNLIHGMKVAGKAPRNAYCCDPQLFPHSCVGYRGTH